MNCHYYYSNATTLLFGDWVAEAGKCRYLTGIANGSHGVSKSPC
jgi:hypothetical protein